MRTLKIYRLKNAWASLTKLTVEMDGKKIGKLANGKDLSIPINEQAHELHIRLGALAGKNASSRLMIPAGSFSYAFQTEMMELTNGTRPVLVPYGGSDKAEPSRIMQLMVSTLTTVLLDQNLRDILVKAPDARLRLVVEEQQWGLVVCAGTERKTVLTQPFSHRKGGLLDAAINRIEQSMDGDLRTPEGRDTFADTIFTKYLQYLPDYQPGRSHELVLKNVP